MEEKEIDGKIYRYVTVRNRSKWVSKDGDIKNNRNQESKVKDNVDGYLVSGGSIPVHLYVGHGWVDGYFEGAEINHKDFNRHNNNADNLEWVTHKENLEYSMTHNYDAVCKGHAGINNGRATLTENDVLKIRKMYSDGLRVIDICRILYPNDDYHSHWSTISYIVKRKSWKNI